MWRTIRSTAFLLLTLGCSSQRGSSAERLEDDRGIAVFTKLDEFSSAKISPDGALIAVTSRIGQQGALVFMRSDTLEVVRGFRFEGTQTIATFEWASNDRLVIELAEDLGPLEQPLRTGELVSFGVDGSRRPIFGFRAGESQIGTRIRKAEGIRAIGSIIDPLPSNPRKVLAEGIADPKRICIYGGSFGGYSALQSAVRAPDLFQCAVGYAGIYDLQLLFEEGDVRRSRFGRAFMAQAVGEDPEALRQASPVHRADELRLPVLLIHGNEDQRAPLDHAKAMERALTQRNKPIETLFVKNEGHGFYDEVNRLHAQQRVLEFIEAHTAAASSP